MLTGKALAATSSGGLPTYIGQASTATAATSLVISKPTGVVDGDTLIAFIFNNPSTGVTPPAGWTRQFGVGDQGDARGMQVYTKTAASEGSSYTFTLNNAGEGTIVAYRDVSYILPSPPFSNTVASSTSTGSFDVEIDAPCDVIAAYDVDTVSISFSAPSGYDTIATNNNASQDSYGLFRKVFDSAGTTGVVTSAHTSASKIVSHIIKIYGTGYVPVTSPSLVNTASNSASGSSVTISVPSGTVDGDLMVAVVASSSGASMNPLTGWTEIVDNSTGDPFYVLYRVAASEPASYTFITSNSTGTRAGTIMTFSNAAYSSIGTLATTNSITIPAVSNEGSLMLLVGAAAASVTITVQDFGDLIAQNTVSASYGVGSRIVPAYTGTSVYKNDNDIGAGIYLVLSPA